MEETLMGGPGSGRKPSPCGTVAKYQWHRKRGEDCPQCRLAASAEARKKYKPKKKYLDGRTSKERKHAARAAVIQAKLDRANCMDCGLQVTLTNFYCFDFDHRVPADKEFSISSYKSDISMARLQAEIDKCDLVCAICHRHRTMQQFSDGILTGTRLKRTEQVPSLFDNDCKHG